MSHVTLSHELFKIISLTTESVLINSWYLSSFALCCVLDTQWINVLCILLINLKIFLVSYLSVLSDFRI